MEIAVVALKVVIVIAFLASLASSAMSRYYMRKLEQAERRLEGLMYPPPCLTKAERLVVRQVHATSPMSWIESVRYIIERRPPA